MLLKSSASTAGRLLLLALLALPDARCLEEASSTISGEHTSQGEGVESAAFEAGYADRHIQDQNQRSRSPTRTLSWTLIVTGKVQRLVGAIEGNNLRKMDLTSARFQDTASSADEQERSFMEGTSHASLECPVSSCPALSRCTAPGNRGSDAGVEWCRSADMVGLTAPNRHPNRTLTKSEGPIPGVWLHSLEFNALDACFTVTLGKAVAEGPAPNVIRPECHVLMEESTRETEGDNSGQVFVLENVFLDSWGRVFNSTHQFTAGGCATSSEFTYGQEMAVEEVDSAVNLMAATEMEASEPLPRRRQVSRFHATAFELPLALLVYRLFRLPRGTLLATHRRKSMHVVLSQLMPGMFRDRNVALRTATPKQGTLWLVKRLVQPAFQPCRRPSFALWERSRKQHILHPDLREGINRAEKESPKPLPLVPPSAPLILPGWRIVVHHRVMSTVQIDPSLPWLITQFFPQERVKVYSRGYTVHKDQSLFGRAPLFVTTSATHSALSNIMFMPPHSTLLLLENTTSIDGRSTSRTRDIAVHLAAACQVRLYIVRCPPKEGESQGALPDGGQLQCDSEAILEVLDRVAMDVFTVTDPPPAESSNERHLAAYQDWADCVSREARWERNETPRLLPWPQLSTSESEAICDTLHAEQGGVVGERADQVAMTGGLAAHWKVREAVKYEWEVPEAACPGAPANQDSSLLRFTPESFCSSVGKGRRILFLGDSLTQQMVASFVNMMLVGAPTPAEEAVKFSIPRQCREWLPDESTAKHAYCGRYRFADSVCPGLKVYFVRNDYLTLHNPRSEDRLPFSRFRFVAKADIIVLNRGAHFEENKKYGRDLRAVLRYLRNRAPNAAVVFRNTPPGHVSCQNISAPLSVRQDPEILPESYGWARFQEQNEIARGLMREYGYAYMDVDRMTALRGDGHKGIKPWDGTEDCLHYCMPGPIDTWNRLLYNTLLWVAPLTRSGGH